MYFFKQEMLRMRFKKGSILVVSIMLLSILLCFQLVACDEEENGGNTVDEYQEITLTKSNFFDYFIPNTVSTLISTLRDPYVSSVYYDKYRVDYSIKCKYSKAICKNVSIEFKVDTDTYKDSNGNSQKYDITKTMELTDDGRGEKSYNYTAMYMPSLYQSEGGIVLSKSTIAKVSGTIKIPKN